MNNNFIIITENLESTLREEVSILFCDHEAELHKNISRQQSLYELTKEDIDEMSKTQETGTKEQMNRVSTTLETGVQRLVR